MNYVPPPKWTVGGVLAGLFVFGMCGFGLFIVGSAIFGGFGEDKEPDVRAQAEEERLQRRIEQAGEAHAERQRQMERDGTYGKSVMERQQEEQAKRWHDAISKPVIDPGNLRKLPEERTR